MSVIRRHLASLGLAVVLCQIVLQVLVPAALCCEAPAGAQQEVKADCCSAAHPGQLCPMHAGKRARAQEPRDGDCHARPVGTLRDLLGAWLTGDLVPPPAPLTVPGGSEPAPQLTALFAPAAAFVPPGPPPRA